MNAWKTHEDPFLEIATKSPMAEVAAQLLTPSSQTEVRRCKLDPSLKATCFQPLNLRVHTVLST